MNYVINNYLDTFFENRKINYFWSDHCYKYKLTKSGSGVFLASHMLEQDLNSGIEYLQEQELKQNKCKKNYAGTSIENNSILVPA